MTLSSIERQEMNILKSIIILYAKMNLLEKGFEEKNETFTIVRTIHRSLSM